MDPGAHRRGSTLCLHAAARSSFIVSPIRRRPHIVSFWLGIELSVSDYSLTRLYLYLPYPYFLTLFSLSSDKFSALLARVCKVNVLNQYQVIKKLRLRYTLVSNYQDGHPQSRCGKMAVVLREVLFPFGKKVSHWLKLTDVTRALDKTTSCQSE